MEQKTYQVARENKDRHYDGRFFFGVSSTGIFCRPSCPSPVAKEKNVTYFNTMFEALNEGYRPCYRCRPDIEVAYYNGNVVGVETVNKALELIYEGYLNHHNLDALAKVLFVSPRHLRTLFAQNIGLSPVKVAKYHKALFAKRLLIYSDMTITNVAYSSGFGSTRQFNDVFKETFGKTPTEVRKASSVESLKHGPEKVNVMLIPYEFVLDYDQVLDFMALRGIEGVEKIVDGVYYRNFRVDGRKGYFTVENDAPNMQLKLSVYSEDIRSYMAIYNRVRKMFDLDCDLEAISDYLGSDQLLQKGMKDGLVPRLPVAFNTFEFVIRAILGQQITINAATTLAGRIAKAAGVKADDTYPEGLDYFFPDPSELKETVIADLGITKTRQQTIMTVTEAVIEGQVSLERNQTYENFYEDFVGLKGIGSWTVNYVAMRGLGMVDSFPAKDLGIIKALSVNGEKAKHKVILERSKDWQPYRAYAALCLWHGLSD